jgi:prepilin-type N-terminal cleavage/methylation domain-containing protein
MRRGHTLLELIVTIGVMGIGVAFAFPKLQSWLDWIAVERAATEFTSALAVKARHCRAPRRPGPPFDPARFAAPGPR